MMKVRLLTAKEFSEAEDARMALAKKRGADPEWLAANKVTYGWASMVDIVGPGAMWETPWYFDPKDPEDQSRREYALAHLDEKNVYLSKFYWQQWSHIRPPLSVLCPNGVEWCIDACASNGPGWTVTGTAPLVTCSPSISVPGYHGWLKNGEFTDDCEGRGPHGIRK